MEPRTWMESWESVDRVLHKNFVKPVETCLVMIAQSFRMGSEKWPTLKAYLSTREIFFGPFCA